MTMPVLGIDASRAVKKEKTGVEWYSYFLLRAMQRCMPQGWKVRLYTPEPPSPDLASARSPSPRGRGEGEGNWECRVLRWPFERGWIQGRLSLAMFAHPPDVLFVPSRILPIVHPERTVTTIHDTVFLTHPELYDPHDLWLQRHGLDFALKFARKIIVPSKATRDDVVRVGGSSEQMIVIPHGVEIEHNAPQPPLNLRGGAGGVTAPYLLFIGRLERKKNVLGLIQAFRRVVHNAPQPPLNLRGGDGGVTSDLKLILAGPLGFGGEDVLQAIKTFKLEGRVVHLGWILREQYLQLLRHASLLILPSFGEGFGFPVLEAMASGTPVVCSDIPVLHELGGNAVQYMNPHDPEDIARAIETVLQNEMLASEMVRRGKERAAQYSWEKAAVATWDVIQSL